MEEKTSSKKMKWTSLISYIVIVLLVCETVVLIIQNRELKSQISNMTMTNRIEPLQPGDQVEPVNVRSLEGQTSELKYNEPGKKNLLFVFSTTCPHCEKTMPVWKELVNRVNGDNLNIMGISVHPVDKTLDYIASRDVNFRTVSSSYDTSFSRKYKISGVPETILLNGYGVVEKTWVGELTEEQEEEIQRLISASLTSIN